MNSIQIEDYNKILDLDFIDWERLKDKSFLISGSTGLIGSNLVNALLYFNIQKNLNIKMVLIVRDLKKAKRIFKENCKLLHIVEYNLGDDVNITTHIDYVVHLASPTSSKYFVEYPADTMLTNINGTKALLEFSKINKVEKFIYISTMEVYGFPEMRHNVAEHEIGSFDTMNVRNSYPIAKIASEALCNAYYNQYGVLTVILRATQTFGPGVSYDDGRVFAQLMRCAMEKKDIVLKSLGFTERSYLYTSDAVSAILVGLLRGEPGNAYTVANPDTYCSIRDMAQIVADKIANGTIDIVFDVVEDIEKLGYSNTLYMNLDIHKFMKLGWKPCIGMLEMFERMIKAI